MLYKYISSGDATLEIIPSILTGIDLSDNTKDYNFQLNEIVFKYKNEKKISKSKSFKIINKNYKISYLVFIIDIAIFSSKN